MTPQPRITQIRLDPKVAAFKYVSFCQTLEMMVMAAIQSMNKIAATSVDDWRLRFQNNSEDAD